MCGIFGLIGTPWRDGARAALDTLRSRGPDDSALLDLGDAVLGHTRLAVIDLVSGQQPMRSADGRYTIVFNGEIYNFRELRKELARAGHDVSLFEIGRVFSRGSSAGDSTEVTAAVREERRMGIAITGQRNPLFWRGEDREGRFDVYDLKGVLEEFFEQFGVRGLNYSRRTESTSLFLESSLIQLGKFRIGEFGQLLPALAHRYDLRDAVLLAELNLDLLLARRNTTKGFKPLPVFPAIRRDVAMIVPEATSHESVLQVIRQAKPANLESVELFDIFRGKNVSAGQKSMAYAFTYRNAQRTLTDAEVNAAHEKLVEQLKQNLSATIREQ